LTDTRWPALQKVGIEDLFSVVLLSYPLGARKPGPLCYELVLSWNLHMVVRCPGGWLDVTVPGSVS
jgi:hypothetical protein